MPTKHKFTNSNYEGLMGCIIFFISAICILSFTSATSKGALQGLKISSNIIIPSLFPFTVISVFLQKSGGLLWVSKKINKITYTFFKLNGTEFSVILISLLGGYPIGSKIIDELYKSRQINYKTAKKLLRFCVNPSPAFFISVVGINILNNKLVGWILLTSNTIACVVLNLLFNNSKKSKNDYSQTDYIQSISLSDAFVESVFSGAQIIISICAWVTLFSAIAEILKPLFLSHSQLVLLCPLLEISFGINEIGKTGIPAFLYSFLLSFGGFSTICQVKQSAEKLCPSFIYIFLNRIIHGATATIISFILFRIFPISSEVFSNGADIRPAEYTLFIPSVMLIVFSVLFLMFLSQKKESINFN